MKYTKNTSVMIDGKIHQIRMYDGMTGIGSRDYWIDGQKQFLDCVTRSGDLTVGNHFIYTMNWRDNPWDKLDIIIHEEEVPWLLNKEVQPEWRNPVKRSIK